MTIKEHIYRYYYRYWLLPTLPVKHQLQALLASRKTIHISFIVSDLSMWRGQELYELLDSNNHFVVSLCLFPFASYAPLEQQKCIARLIHYCESNNIKYYDLTKCECPAQFLRDVIKPNVLFYPQPYYNLYSEGLSSECFKDILLCYIHYGSNTIDTPWLFNQKFHNFAWRLYFFSIDALYSARHFADNKGINVRVVGNPTGDLLSKKSVKTAWKIPEKKHIIWAPHYSIENGFFNNNSFIELHDIMLNLADEYKDSICFAFKPHPKLLSTLYNHPKWGEKRANDYYRQWECRSNTQLETGEFINLFRGSDGMIHDSVSFTIEYLYTQKPVLFFTKDKDQTTKGFNRIGNEAFNAHYIGNNEPSIRAFIEEVILKEEDPLASKRQDVYNHYLKPVNGRSAAENIYNDLLESFGL